MIGSLVDSVVGVFSPEKALKRRLFRKMLNRGYDAAKRDRTNSDWRTTNSSADLELLGQGDLVRARAHDLVRNNAYAQGAIRAPVRNVVGCGIKPQARAQFSDGKPRTLFNEQIEKHWKRWQKQADVTGRLTFYEMQRLILRERAVAGEVLVHMTTVNDPNRIVPFALELVDADRLASDYMFPRGINHENGNQVRRGVEIDSLGRPVAYHLYPSHPNDLNAIHHQAERVPASEFLHLFKQDRVGQTRGVSDFAPTTRWLRDLHYYVENELQSSAVASCFSVAIKSMAAGADGGLVDDIDDDATDTDGNTFEYLQPGIVSRLFPGEDVEVINPTRANTAANEWIQLIQRSIAVGMGLSYERLVRDYSQTNFSSNRASDLEDRREFRAEQDWLVNHLCDPVYRQFCHFAVREMLPGMPNAQTYVNNLETYTSVHWQTPGWEWVDPDKQAKASINALNNNLTTLADELGKQGRDWLEVLDQKAIEKQALEERGLTMAGLMAETSEDSDGDEEETEAETGQDANERAVVSAS